MYVKASEKLKQINGNMSNRGRHKKQLGSIIKKYRDNNLLGRLSTLSDAILTEILEERVRQGLERDLGYITMAPFVVGPKGFDWKSSVKGYNYWNNILGNL